MSPSWPLLYACLLVGCAPDGREPRPDEDPTTQDTIDIGPDPAVVAIVDGVDPPDLVCSGSLIAEHVVLTAAHCAVQTEEPLAVFFGQELFGEGVFIRVAQVATHPDADGTADRDLALFLLEEAAPSDPVELAPDAGIAAPPPVSVRLVGFGRSAPDAQDAPVKDGGTSETVEVQPEHVVLGAAPFLPCRGDSGGPVFLPGPSGEVLAAVISRGDESCSERARATRLDAHLDGFVDPVLEEWAPGRIAQGDPCLYDDQCERGECARALDDPSLRFCAAPCPSNDACEAPLTCRMGLCRHPLPSPGAFGSSCSTDEDCVDGSCVDETGTCSTRCVSGQDDCPGGTECQHAGGVDFFCMPAPVEEKSCSSAGTGERDPAAMLLAVLSVLRRKR